VDCNEVRTLVHASFDGELDLVREMDLQAHVESCPACARTYERLRALRGALQRADLYVRAPDTLKQRVRAAVAAEHAAAPRVVRYRFPRLSSAAWGTFAAAAAIILVATAVWLLRSRPSESDLLAQEIVASHIRSLLPGHLTDVLSSDQHTVKPWFAGRVDFSPPVVDFAAQGFPLVGGRLDYVGGRTVAALVYRRRQHVVNLFIWPFSQQSTIRTAVHGYNVERWSHAGMSYSLVSDLNPTELQQFAQLIRAVAP
jgi:anti-sigma factor RsiW